MSFWLISGNIFMLLKIQNLIWQYSVFIKTFKNTKKFKNRKYVFMHTAICLKAKKTVLCFSYTKKQCFSMHFGFNNQFIKFKRTLAKISKITKILFCFVLISKITNLYVKRIPDIKNIFSFEKHRKIRFLPDKIMISLQRRTFLKP